MHSPSAKPCLVTIWLKKWYMGVLKSHSFYDILSSSFSLRRLYFAVVCYRVMVLLPIFAWPRDKTGFWNATIYFCEENKITNIRRFQEIFPLIIVRCTYGEARAASVQHSSLQEYRWTEWEFSILTGYLYRTWLF